jgi:hypothetical protein
MFVEVGARGSTVRVARIDLAGNATGTATVDDALLSGRSVQGLSRPAVGAQATALGEVSGRIAALTA